MKKITLGILDYGAGNTNSVKLFIDTLGYRSRLISHESQFDNIPLLIIPGVGAFPSAMDNIKQLDLINPIKEFAQQGNGIIGICLGMQLLANCSYEFHKTEGLGLIPGEVKALENPNWHIGWNSLHSVKNHPWMENSSNEDFYFNHSYTLNTSPEYILSTAELNKPITSVVKRDNIYGFQFHPEKSQRAGRRLMGNTIKEILNA